MLKKYTKKGKILFFTGIIIFIIGYILNDRDNMWDVFPDPYPSFATPIMIFGVILVFATNFFIDRSNQK